MSRDRPGLNRPFETEAEVLAVPAVREVLDAIVAAAHRKGVSAEEHNTSCPPMRSPRPGSRRAAASHSDLLRSAGSEVIMTSRIPRARLARRDTSLPRLCR